MSLRVSCESEGVEVKSGPPLGPTSNSGWFSSAASRRDLEFSSKRPSKPLSAAATEASPDSSPSPLDLVFLAFLTLDLVPVFFAA